MRAYNDHTNDIIEEIHDYCIDIASRQIFLHAQAIGADEDSGTDFRMSNRFLKNLLYLEKKPESITVHQHNIGGDWGSCFMIYDAIYNASSHINMVCHGEVCSAGTVILQAADTRAAMPNCFFMFHYGNISADDNHLPAQSWFDFADKMTKNMLDIYANKCKKGVQFEGKTHSQVKAILNRKFKDKGDWFLNSEEAKEYGFIDKIIGVDCELKDL